MVTRRPEVRLTHRIVTHCSKQTRRPLRFEASWSNLVNDLRWQLFSMPRDTWPGHDTHYALPHQCLQQPQQQRKSSMAPVQPPEQQPSLSSPLPHNQGSCHQQQEQEEQQQEVEQEQQVKSVQNDGLLATEYRPFDVMQRRSQHRSLALHRASSRVTKPRSFKLTFTLPSAPPSFTPPRPPTPGMPSTLMPAVSPHTTPTDSMAAVAAGLPARAGEGVVAQQTGTARQDPSSEGAALGLAEPIELPTVCPCPTTPIPFLAALMQPLLLHPASSMEQSPGRASSGSNARSLSSLRARISRTPLEGVPERMSFCTPVSSRTVSNLRGTPQQSASSMSITSNWETPVEGVPEMLMHLPRLVRPLAFPAYATPMEGVPERGLPYTTPGFAMRQANKAATQQLLQQEEETLALTAAAVSETGAVATATEQAAAEQVAGQQVEAQRASMDAVMLAMTMAEAEAAVVEAAAEGAAAASAAVTRAMAAVAAPLETVAGPSSSPESADVVLASTVHTSRQPAPSRPSSSSGNATLPSASEPSSSEAGTCRQHVGQGLGACPNVPASLPVPSCGVAAPSSSHEPLNGDTESGHPSIGGTASAPERHQERRPDRTIGPSLSPAPSYRDSAKENESPRSDAGGQVGGSDPYEQGGDKGKEGVLPQALPPLDGANGIAEGGSISLQEITVAAVQKVAGRSKGHQRSSDAFSREHELFKRRKSLAGGGLINDDELGTRRSTRQHLRPLEYWRNEHKTYGRQYKSLPTIVSVETVTPDPQWPAPSDKAHHKRTRARTRQ